MNTLLFLSSFSSSSPPPPPPPLNMQDLFQSSIPSLPGRIFSTTSSAIAAIGSGHSRILGSSYPLTHHHQAPIKCPRCDSTNTKFCYYNNYNLSQPRHYCKSCRRYWTKGGLLRNIPVGGGCRKNSSKRSRPKSEKNTQTRQEETQTAPAAAATGSSSDSNPDPVFPDTVDGSLTGLVAAAGVSGFGFPDPDRGLTGLEWPGSVDPTTPIFDLAEPSVEPVMYWGDADLSSFYLP